MEIGEVLRILLPALELKKSGRIDEAHIILKKIVEINTIAELRFMAAREISLTWVKASEKDEVLKQKLFANETVENKEFCKYLKIAVKAYGEIPQSMQQEFKINGFKEMLNELESSSAESASYKAAQNIAEQLLSMKNEFCEGRRQLFFEFGMEHVARCQSLRPKLVKTFARNDDSVIEETRNLLKTTGVFVICDEKTGQFHLYELFAGKSGGCFIATAAFGTTLAPEVLYLQQYRNYVLGMSKPGRTFVNVYYVISPPIARVISKSILLKALTRVLFLKPVIKILRYLYPAKLSL